MWLVISVCFITVTAILGITEIIRRFWLFIMCPKDSTPFVLVVKLKEGIAVQQLRYALEFLSWEKQGYFSSVAVITTELKPETEKEIRKIANHRKDVFIHNEA